MYIADNQLLIKLKACGKNIKWTAEQTKLV